MPRLTKAQVVAIRVAVSRGSSYADEALKHGVTPEAVGQIVCGRSHSDAGGPIRSPRPKRQTLTRGQVRVLRARAARGEDFAEIAKALGIDRDDVSRIARGTNYAGDGGRITKRGSPRGAPRVYHLTDDVVLKIRELARAGFSYDTIAKQLAIRTRTPKAATSLISRIARGATYVEVGGPRTRRG